MKTFTCHLTGQNSFLLLELGLYQAQWELDGRLSQPLATFIVTLQISAVAAVPCVYCEMESACSQNNGGVSSIAPGGGGGPRIHCARNYGEVKFKFLNANFWPPSMTCTTAYYVLWSLARKLSKSHLGFHALLCIMYCDVGIATTTVEMCTPYSTTSKGHWIFLKISTFCCSESTITASLVTWLLEEIVTTEYEHLELKMFFISYTTSPPPNFQVRICFSMC